ncbi:MAG: hypothetical protein ABR500_08215 [Dermatophilaceae bacterium]|nr:hypothetical protein [Intrasporangiaceae bacterium]
MTPLQGLDGRAAAFALALPDDVVFSHVTAARLWGLPLPRCLESPGDHDPLHVMRITSRPAVERSGCVHHRGLERRTVTRVKGVPVTSVADTWCDLIEACPKLSLGDAVMLGDAAVEAIQPTKWVDERHSHADPASSEWWADPVAEGCRALREPVIVRRSFRGRRLAWAALRLIRPRVWSPMESYSRVVLVEAELPEPELNATITHDDGGGFIAIGDLVWRKQSYRRRVVGEYNGATHEQPSARESDHSKRLLLEDEGWKVLEIYARDVFTASGRFTLVHRLRGLL